MRYVVLVLGFVLGVGARERIRDSFPLFYRGQAALLGAPLALLAGWSFAWRPTSLLALVCLLIAELATIAVALRLVRRGDLSPVTAVASTSNSGFWSTPIAGAMFGPAGTAFAVVYDIVGAIRPFIIVRTLRSKAPEVPSRRSALVDYLPAAALILGLSLQWLAPIPTTAEDLIPWLAVVLGAVGFFALGAAMPETWPQKRDFVAAAPVVPLRFTVPFLAMLGLRALGVEVSSGAWVVALAPNAFLVIAMARLYGYDRRGAAAVVLIALPMAVLLLPLAAALGGN